MKCVGNVEKHFKTNNDKELEYSLVPTVHTYIYIYTYMESAREKPPILIRLAKAPQALLLKLSAHRWLSLS